MSVWALIRLNTIGLDALDFFLMDIYCHHMITALSCSVVVVVILSIILDQWGAFSYILQGWFSSTSAVVQCMSWWHLQMETVSALLALYEGNSPVTDEFPSQRPVTRSFDDLFDLRLNKQLNKKLTRRWFKTQSRTLWHHCNIAVD